jgi:hypothetical protein
MRSCNNQECDWFWVDKIPDVSFAYVVFGGLVGLFLLLMLLIKLLEMSLEGYDPIQGLKKQQPAPRESVEDEGNPLV